MIVSFVDAILTGHLIWGEKYKERTQITGEKKPAGQLVFNRLEGSSLLCIPVESVGHIQTEEILR